MFIKTFFFSKTLAIILIISFSLENITIPNTPQGVFTRKHPLFTNSTSFNSLTIKSLLSFTQIKDTIVSLDSKYTIFSVFEWDSESKSQSKYLRYADLSNPLQSFPLTNKLENQLDSSPYFTSEFPNFLIFSRLIKSQKTQLWYLEFPPSQYGFNERQLTNYKLTISNILIKHNLLVFTIEGDVTCKGNLECLKQKKEEIDSNGYFIYDNLMVRHWNHWTIQGHCNHPFYQVIEQEGNELILKQKPHDMLQGELIDAPPLSNSANEISISNDGRYIAFSFLRNDRNKAWNTRWEISLFDRENNQQEIITTNALYHFKGRNQNPKFNPKGNTLHFLSMERPGLESDHYMLYTYNIITKTIKDYQIFTTFQPDIEDYEIYEENNIEFIILLVIEKGYRRLYMFDYKNITLITNDDLNAYTKPISIGNNKYIIQQYSYMKPHILCLMSYKINVDQFASFTSFLDLNSETLKQYVLSEPIYFTYSSEIGTNDIQGWLLKPINFRENHKYPMVLLIHGGPEGSWKVNWSTGWNPQIWAQNGYVTVMINPHGSLGMGRDFKDAVRNDWGGLPYRDLMRGVDYVLQEYPFIDENRLGACGGSYGGYMVNWIQGNTERFKALVTHSGVFSTINMFYSTEELWFAMVENCPLNSVGCTPYENAKSRANYERFNPERNIAKWKTPHLVLHGSLDYRVPKEEGIALFTALQLKGIPSRFVHFPFEDHWILNNDNNIQWYTEVIGWLDKYLKYN